MKAYLRSARIAPRKANIVATMVRGMRVDDALTALGRTNKKGARLVENLLKSAVANAEHNDKQHKSHLMIKSIVVNQAAAYSRGVPMARGRMRPMQKFLSHISLTLGISEGVHEEKMAKKETKSIKKTPVKASQTTKNKVQKKKDVSTEHASKADTKESSSSASSDTAVEEETSSSAS